jgi:hypothetical protein
MGRGVERERESGREGSRLALLEGRDLAAGEGEREREREV